MVNKNSYPLSGYNHLFGVILPKTFLEVKEGTYFIKVRPNINLEVPCFPIYFYILSCIGVLQKYAQRLLKKYLTFCFKTCF